MEVQAGQTLHYAVTVFWPFYSLCLIMLPAAAEDAAVAIASLADIAAASKGGEDPDPDIGDQTLAADVLWSDPQNEPGVLVGARDGGVGIRFGPDVTEVCAHHMMCLLCPLPLL